MIDSQGYPGTQGEDGQFDGGDTAAIIGTILALYDQMPRHLQSQGDILTIKQDQLIKLGVPVRHPDESKWYGQNDRFSRDQLIPSICSVTQRDCFYREKLYQAHKKLWFLRAWNRLKNGSMSAPSKAPDFTGPEVWALWLRCYKPWWRHLVLWFLDIETLIGAIHWLWRSDRVCRNQMLVIINGMRFDPTPTMRLANWLTNWPDLVNRWQGHCADVREHSTSKYFRRAVEVLRL